MYGSSSLLAKMPLVLNPNANIELSTRALYVKFESLVDSFGTGGGGTLLLLLLFAMSAMSIFESIAVNVENTNRNI